MPENWSECIRQYRMRYGLTQKEFAIWMGVSQRTISRWERGEDQPSAEKQQRLREMGWKPAGLLLRNLALSVKHCPAPRALSYVKDLRLIEVSGAAIAKRPSIVNWVGCSMQPIATGVLAEVLSDNALQCALRKRELSGLVTTTESVLDTGDSTNFGKFNTTISYFYQDGDLYSDAIAAPAPDDAACGYQPIFHEEQFASGQL